MLQAELMARQARCSLQKQHSAKMTRIPHLCTRPCTNLSSAIYQVLLQFFFCNHNLFLRLRLNELHLCGCKRNDDACEKASPLAYTSNLGYKRHLLGRLLINDTRKQPNVEQDSNSLASAPRRIHKRAVLCPSEIGTTCSGASA